MKTLIAAGAVALLAASAQAAETHTYDVVFHDTVLGTTFDALSPGDRVILNDVLLQNGAETGSAIGVCTIIDTQLNTAICSLTFTLADGSLAVQFVNSPPPEKQFPILGGTGAYAGRGGIGTLVENGDGTGSVRFDLQ